MDRDETVERMKKALDNWNARIAEWEQGMNDAQASMKSHYQEQVDSLRAQREEAVRKLAQIQDSSEAAWKETSKGFEQAWQDIADGFENAWSEFKSKASPKDEPGKGD